MDACMLALQTIVNTLKCTQLHYFLKKIQGAITILTNSQFPTLNYRQYFFGSKLSGEDVPVLRAGFTLRRDEAVADF